MTIDKNAVVSVNYKLTNQTTGEFVEETNTQDPLVFLFGTGALIPDFETNLAGKKVGDTFDFSIKAENAYGAATDEHIVELPITIFHMEDGKIDETMIFVDAVVPMTDNDGNRVQGTVKEINADNIKMDFNHPLAGQDIHFSGEVLAVREATQEEIEHGHVHGEGGHHH